MKITDMSYKERLAGLAEEASELSQAALKLRRVLDGTNPTPMPMEIARNNFLEEIADVMLYLSTIDINYSKIAQIMADKQNRWEKRLNENE